MDAVAAEAQESSRAFGREARLRCQSHFTMVREQGCSEAGRYCVVNILRPPPDGTKRAAFCISRRFSKLAVVRNRTRRLFREVYRELYPKLPPSWLLFIPRRHIMKAKMQEVLQDAASSLEKLGVPLTQEQRQ